MRRFKDFTTEELEYMKSYFAYGKLHEEICEELKLRKTDIER